MKSNILIHEQKKTNIYKKYINLENHESKLI